MAKKFKRVKCSWDDQHEINRQVYSILSDLTYNASNYSKEIGDKLYLLACTIKPIPLRRNK